MSKTFYCFNHQSKGKAFVNALQEAGWTQVSPSSRPDVVLADSDVTPLRLENLKRLHDAGSKVFVFPHAARVNISYDFPGVTPFDGTIAQFVSAETHKRVLEIIGYPKPVHVVGWSYCPIVPFRPVRQVQKVLFAPIHANGNNWLSDLDKDLNYQTMDRLLRAKKANGFELQVRFIGNLESCGLKRVEGVKFFRGEPNQSYNMIDRADLIVSHQTFAYIAVARGRPTLMMGEGLTPRMGNAPENLCLAKNWDEYKHLLMYPYDILAVQDTYGLMEQVAKVNPAVESWKRNVIGVPFDGRKFVRDLVGHLQENERVLSGV